MIILNLIGGLGNEMFIYALAFKYLKIGREVFIDDRWIRQKEENNAHFIENYFDIDLPKASKKMCEQLTDDNPCLIYRVKRALLGTHRKVYIDSQTNAQTEILNFENMYLYGFWQSHKYFDDIRDFILEKYQFKDFMTSYQKEILMEIEQSNSVSMHLRRGDYIDLSDIYGGICTDNYYEKAVQEFVGDDVKFFIFSNDIEFAKEKYGHKRNCVIVKPESNYPSCNMDMMLMSHCKHNIIANSSFSWWGAYLNQNEEKKVIAPSKWLNIERNDMWCDGWIKI